MEASRWTRSTAKPGGEVVRSFYGDGRELGSAVVRLHDALLRGSAEIPPELPPWLRSVIDGFPWEEAVPLREAAAIAGLHESHFSRAFRRHVGMTANAYRARARIRLASKMLLTTTVPIARIASSTGFSDQSHLTRAFSRSLGSRRPDTAEPSHAKNLQDGASPGVYARGMIGLIASVSLACNAAALFAQVAVATGGAAWDHVGEITASGRLVSSGLRGTAELRDDIRDGRYARWSMLPVKGSEAEAYDGQSLWARDISGGVHPYDSWYPRARAVTEAFLTRRGYLDPHSGIAMTCVGFTGSGADRAERTRVAPRGGIPAIVAVDTTGTKLKGGILLVTMSSKSNSMSSTLLSSSFPALSFVIARHLSSSYSSRSSSE